MSELSEEAKPRLRGWLHAAMVPIGLVAGIVLVVLTPTAPGKIAVAVFALSAVLVFAVSAAYHTRAWTPRARSLLRRFDHANIFVLIAGSYTPFAVLLLPHRSSVILLTVVWSGAVLGAVFRVSWLSAPRWLYVPIYLGLGWAAVFWAPAFARAGHPATLVLMVVGGALYTVGAVVYGAKRPNPFPGWFGFHEIFHSLTIAAFVSHYVGVLLITRS